MTSSAKRLHSSHVQFADPDMEGIWFFEGFPCPVVLDTGTHVWVKVALMDRLPPGTLAVGTGMDSGFDHMGNRIVAVPERYAVNWLDEQEASDIVLLLDVDAARVSNH